MEQDNNSKSRLDKFLYLWVKLNKRQRPSEVCTSDFGICNSFRLQYHSSIFQAETAAVHEAVNSFRIMVA